MAGLPLSQPRLHSPAVMLNLLGDIWLEGKLGEKLGSDPNFPNFPEVLSFPGTHLHLYGKGEARKGRKMGHLTVTSSTSEQASAIASQAARILGIAAF